MQVFLAFLKLHWQKVIGVVTLVSTITIATVIFGNQKKSYVDEFRRLEMIHETEVKAINEARIEEQRKHEENVKNYERALQDARLQYEASLKSFAESKKKEVNRIVADHGEDPAALAQILAEATGLEIVHGGEK